MTIDEAREILGDIIQPNNRLLCMADYVLCEPGWSSIRLDGEFTVQQLEAFTVWMRAHADIDATEDHADD